MPSEEPGALRKLGAALLNATLMLVALVLLLAVVLVWQLRGLASDMRSGLRAELVAVQPQIEAAREQARAAVESLGDSATETAARRDLLGAIERLEALDPDTMTSDQTESVMRQLVFSIISMAARGILGEEPPANAR